MKKGFECTHLKISNIGLRGLLKKTDLGGLPSNVMTFRTMADIYWRRYFNFENYEIRNRRFADEILTDGKAVSIVLRKPHSGITVGHTTKLDFADFAKI